MTPTTAARPDSGRAWTLSGNARDTLSLATAGRNWINGLVASGHSATAAVTLRINGADVARITLRAGSTWSPSLAVPQPLPAGATVEVTSDETAHVSVFGFGE